MSEQGIRSFKARPSLEKADLCGCYFCIKIYSPKEIEEWVDGKLTAICPKCGIDSVVPYEEKDETIVDFLESLEKWQKESFW